jgi:ABC-type taurine transport system ATPase subunit
MEGCQPDAWPAARGVFCDRVKLDATIGLAHDDWRLAASTGGGAGGAGTGRALWAVRAIDNVSLMVRTGERHVLLGTNGAGKTTLFNAISGYLRATSE